MAKPQSETLAGESCFICGFANRHALEEHHIVPRSAGGEDSEQNLVTLCSNCHSAVSTMYSRWFFKRLWTLFNAMDHPPALVKHNPPKGLKYNESNRLVPDYDDGFERMLKAIELTERGVPQKKISDRCGIGEGTAMELNQRYDEKRDLYFQFVEDGDLESSDLSDWL